MKSIVFRVYSVQLFFFIMYNYLNIVFRLRIALQYIFTSIYFPALLNRLEINYVLIHD